MDRPYGTSDFAFPSRWEWESGPDLVERAGQGSRADREQSQTGRGKGSNSTRSRGGFDWPVTIYRGRDREYSLRESEVRTLTDLGKFRVVPEDDLARFGYQGNHTQMASDIRSLTRQGLVEQRTIEGHSSYSTKVLTLIWNDLSSAISCFSFFFFLSSPVILPCEAAEVAVEAAIATVDHSDIRGSKPHNRDPSGAASD